MVKKHQKMKEKKVNNCGKTVDVLFDWPPVFEKYVFNFWADSDKSDEIIKLPSILFIHPLGESRRHFKVGYDPRYDINIIFEQIRNMYKKEI